MNENLPKNSLWIRVFSRVPLSIWYPIARFLAWMAWKITPYRRHVVLANLKASFPEWDDAQRELVIRDYYRGFADMLVETLRSLRLTPEELQRRVQLRNPELLREEIAKQLARNAVSHAVPELVEDALRKAGDSSDNVTVVAMEWETPDAFESTQGVSTDSISDDVFASTIQAGPLDGLVDDLDDAAIERSIAEINEAIRRSAARKA